MRWICCRKRVPDRLSYRVLLSSTGPYIKDSERAIRAGQTGQIKTYIKRCIWICIYMNEWIRYWELSHPPGIGIYPIFCHLTPSHTPNPALGQCRKHVTFRSRIPYILSPIPLQASNAWVVVPKPLHSTPFLTTQRWTARKETTYRNDEKKEVL